MLYDSDDENDGSQMVTAKWHCDLVRKKISEFIATKAMTQSAFQKEIGVSPPSYYSFMRQKGKWNGSGNGTFWGATRFFTAREKSAKAEKAAEKAAMATMPAAEKKRKREADAAASSSKKNSIADLLAKVRAVDDDEVSSKGVYDTCDEVRKKSLEFMASTGMTQTAFLREIASTAGKPTPVAPNPPPDDRRSSLRSPWQGRIPLSQSQHSTRILTGSVRTGSSGSDTSSPSHFGFKLSSWCVVSTWRYPHRKRTKGSETSPS